METFISRNLTENISLKMDSLFHLLILYKLCISSEGLVALEFPNPFAIILWFFLWSLWFHQIMFLNAYFTKDPKADSRMIKWTRLIPKCCCTLWNRIGLKASCITCRRNARMSSRWWSEQPASHCRALGTAWLSTLCACWICHLRAPLFLSSHSLCRSWCFILKHSLWRQKQ